MQGNDCHQRGGPPKRPPGEGQVWVGPVEIMAKDILSSERTQARIHAR